LLYITFTTLFSEQGQKDIVLSDNSFKTVILIYMVKKRTVSSQKKQQNSPHNSCKRT